MNISKIFHDENESLFLVTDVREGNNKVTWGYYILLKSRETGEGEEKRKKTKSTQNYLVEEIKRILGCLSKTGSGVCC